MNINVRFPSMQLYVYFTKEMEDLFLKVKKYII